MAAPRASRRCSPAPTQARWQRRRAPHRPRVAQEVPQPTHVPRPGAGPHAPGQQAADACHILPRQLPREASRAAHQRAKELRGSPRAPSTLHTVAPWTADEGRWPPHPAAPAGVRHPHGLHALRPTPPLLPACAPTTAESEPPTRASGSAPGTPYPHLRPGSTAPAPLPAASSPAM